MSKIYLFDTDIIIDYLRNQLNAIKYLENMKSEIILSTITIAELYAGIKKDAEQNALQQFLEAFRIVPVNLQIAELGGLLKNQFAKSHGTGLADALIAATSIHYSANLVSLNKKHFPMIKNLIVPYTEKHCE